LPIVTVQAPVLGQEEFPERINSSPIPAVAEKNRSACVEVKISALDLSSAPHPSIV